MPRKRRNAKKGGAMSREATASQPRHLSQIPYAQSRQRRANLSVVMASSGGHQAKVRCQDLVSLIPGGGFTPGAATSLYFTPMPSGVGLTYSAAFLPRLRQIGSIYSRYRVRSARVHFQALAPATANGSIAIALAPGITQSPSSIGSLMSFACSTIGPVWQDSSTPVWRNLEDRWFAAQGTEIPFAIHILSSDENASTLPVGLFWLEVEIDFADLAAPRQESSSWLKTAAQTIPIGPSTALATLVWDRLNSQSGYWQWAANLLQQYWSSGTLNDLPRGSTFDVDGYQYVEWNADLLLTAATVSATTGCGAPGTAAKWIVTGSDDDHLLVEEKEGVAPVRGHHPLMTPDERAVHSARRSQVKLGRNIASGQITTYASSTAEGMPLGRTSIAVQRPAAAGDVTIYLSFQAETPDTDVVNVYTASYAPGTGATELLAQWSGYVSTPGHFFVQVFPVNGETRDVSALSSTSMEVVSAAASSA